jgi:hypothetical protein
VTAPGATPPPGWTASSTPPPTLEAATADTSANGEAALYAIATTSSDLSQREAAISALLGRSKTNIDFLALSRLASPAIAELTQAQPALRDPVLFATASAMAWDVKTSSAIRASIQQDASPSSAPLDLALLDAMIASRSGKGEGLALDRLIERGSRGDAKTRGRAQAAALLMAQAGAPMSPKALAELASFELAPARIAALYASATEKRMGETALVALAIAEPASQGLGTPERAAIAGALHKAGFQRETSETVVQGLVALMGK